MSEEPVYLLLVEDSPGDAQLTQELLAEHGDGALPPLRWVQSVAAALETLLHAPGCQAVLLDLGLPDNQGMNAVRAIAAHSSTLPVIVLTGSDSAPMSVDAVSSGAQDYLVKAELNASALHRALQMATQRKRLEAEARALSLRDELTGLPRRNLLLDRLQLAMAQARRTASSGAVLFLDLDGFKRVNDLYGHQAGDAVLQTIARRLQDTTRETDTVARLGGDEFVVLLPQVSDIRDAQAVGQKLLQAIEQPVLWQSTPLRVSASVGLARFAGQAENATTLLERADQAMYRAKAAGKGQVVEV